MGFREEIREFRKQEAWITASLFSPEERRASRRRARLRAVGVLAAYGLAHFVVPWWAALAGLAGIVTVAILRFEKWDRRRYVWAFFNLRRNVGSATVLTGKVHYAVVFVRPTHRAKNRVRHAMAELEGALGYLSTEAQRYGKTITFENVLESPLYLVLRRPKAVGRNLLEDGFTKELGKKIGCLPIAEMSETKNFFLVAFTSGGDYRACAMPKSRLDDDRDGIEYCVCPDGETATTIAHEILHLFGARDLYVEGEDDESWNLRDEMVSRARTYTDDEVFNDAEGDKSIMAHPTGDPKELKVTPATAYAVGWLDRLPEPMTQDGEA